MCGRITWVILLHCIAGTRPGGGDLWSEAEPSGTLRAAWRLEAATMGVATARSLSLTLSSLLELLVIKCLCSWSLQRVAGDTASDAEGENSFLPVCHPAEGCLSP